LTIENLNFVEGMVDLGGQSSPPQKL
jgi:hypothetical protein